MTSACYEWESLVAHRYAEGASEPPQWDEAMAHAGHCDDCRRAALAADPSLVFLGCSPTDLTEGELTELRRSIPVTVRMMRVDRAASDGAARRRRIAVAAMLVVGVLATATTVSRKQALQVEPLSAALPAAPLERPMLEALDRPAARVYELGSDGLSLVMVVDESLDV